MELDDIFNYWNTDSKIDSLDLANEALKIPKLHNKYLRFHSEENLKLKKLESQYKKLVSLKYEYYSGVLNGTEELKKLGWEPFLKVILKSDISRYVDGDQDIQKLVMLIDNQKEKVDVLTSILKEVMTRNFIIKNAIEYMKFTNGVV